MKLVEASIRASLPQGVYCVAIFFDPDTPEGDIAMTRNCDVQTAVALCEHCSDPVTHEDPHDLVGS